MTTYTWDGITGDWNDAGDWNPASGPPTATDATLIAAGGPAYVVSVDSSDAALSLDLSSSSATLDISSGGVLSLATTLLMTSGVLAVGNGGLLEIGTGIDLLGGALQLDAGGAISGGTLAAATGTVAWNGGALSSVTYEGTLNLNKLGAAVVFEAGSKVVKKSGSGPGVINVSGGSADLEFIGSQTVSDETINLGVISRFVSLTIEDASNVGNQVLTLAGDVTINAAGYALITAGSAAGDGVVNEGLITQTANDVGLRIAGDDFSNSGQLDAAGANSYFTVETTNFLNSGAISASGGGIFSVFTTNFSTTTASTITVGANSTLTFDVANDWTNLGSIVAAAGSTIKLYGDVSAANLGAISNLGTIEIGGVYDNSGQTIDGSGGIGHVALVDGTIEGGVVTSAGLSFYYDGGVLDDVTYEGGLTLGDESWVELTNGSTVVGASGSRGLINATASGDNIFFVGTQTVANDTIDVGGNDVQDNIIFSSANSAAATLTLASDDTIYATGNVTIANGDYGTGTADIINQGKIQQYYGRLIIDGDTFENDGSIVVGGTTYIYPDDLINTGSITVTSGGVLWIGPQSFTTSSSSVISVGSSGSAYVEVDDWVNNGVVKLASGSELFLSGDVSPASLGKIKNSGGSIIIEGVYENAGRTLSGVGPLGVLGLQGGTISGGVATSAGVFFAADAAADTLSGVKFKGPLDVATAGVNVAASNGTTFVGSSGSGPGLIDLSGQSDGFSFDGTQTFDDATLELGAASGGISLLSLIDPYPPAGPQSLTLGSTATVNASGIVEFVVNGASGDALINQGVINASAGEWFVYAASFTNLGSINLASAEKGSIEATQFTNFASNTLAGGSYSVGANATLTIDGVGRIAALDADVSLDGPGSEVQIFNPKTYATTSLDSSLRTIVAGGELQLLDGRDWTLAASVVNKGTINLAGGAIDGSASGAKLSDIAGSEFSGFGAIESASFANSGTLAALGGLLAVTGPVSGHGADVIVGAATLEFEGSVTSGQTIEFAGAGGTLDLLDPSGFAAHVDGFDANGGANSAIEVGAPWTFGGYSQASGSIGKLTFDDGSVSAEITLAGQYAAGKFHAHTLSSGATVVTYG